jgi:uncharacterized protein (TIGR03000 family)
MYSIVLMTALTTGGSAPDWWGSHHHAGPVSSNCYGCYGGSYYGSWGCYGYGGYGGGHCGGGFGCYGGGWGYGGGLDYGCFGCHGCYGCAGVFGGCVGYNPYGPSPTSPEQIPPPKVEEKKGAGMGAVTPDRAKVVVQLPADAKLYVDDQPVKAADRQTFSTPRLERGQTYYYDVRAEVVRDGKTVVESKRVLVRAGQEVSVTFPKLEPRTVDVAATGPDRR